jgi:hypothetical protein
VSNCVFPAASSFHVTELILATEPVSPVQKDFGLRLRLVATASLGGSTSKEHQEVRPSGFVYAGNQPNGSKQKRQRWSFAFQRQLSAEHKLLRWNGDSKTSAKQRRYINEKQETFQFGFGLRAGCHIL